jgi:hypothetical protein
MHHPSPSGHRLRRGAHLLAPFVALVMLAGVLTSTASAQIPTTIHGVQVMKRESASDSVNQKGIFTACPQGKVLLSPGARITPFNSLGGFSPLASLQQLVEEETLRGASALGRELPFGTLDNWHLTASAICAVAPPGRAIVKATSARNSETTKGVSVSCPFGKTLLGPTARVNGGSGHVILDDFTPTADRKAVLLRAFEDSFGTNEDWSLTVGAICVSGDPLEVERIVADSAVNSDPIKTANAKCSLGKTLLGVGGEISGASGDVSFNAINPGDGGASDQSVNVAAREINGGTAFNWSVRAFAICARTAA